jgi:hypothetical protein
LIKIKISEFYSEISWDFLKNVDRKDHVTFCFQNGTVNGDPMSPLTIKLNYSEYNFLSRDRDIPVAVQPRCFERRPPCVLRVQRSFGVRKRPLTNDAKDRLKTP